MWMDVEVEGEDIKENANELDDVIMTEAEISKDIKTKKPSAKRARKNETQVQEGPGATTATTLRRSTREGRGTGGDVARKMRLEEQIDFTPKKAQVIDEQFFSGQGRGEKNANFIFYQLRTY